MIKSELKDQFLKYYSFPSYLSLSNEPCSFLHGTLFFFFFAWNSFSPFPHSSSCPSFEIFLSRTFTAFPEFSSQGMHLARSCSLTARCASLVGTFHAFIKDSSCLGPPLHWEPLQGTSDLLLDLQHLEQSLTQESAEGIEDLGSVINMGFTEGR